MSTTMETDRLVTAYAILHKDLKALPSLILYFLAFAALYGFGILLHRLLFHPLRSHPGPFWAKFSDLYNTYHIVKKDEAKNFHLLHDRYGPVVRYGPNRLSVKSADAVRMLYTNTRYTMKADSYLAFPRDPENASLFSIINKQAHTRKRRVLRHGFSESSLQEAQGTIKKHVATMLRCIEHLEDDDQEGYRVDGLKPGQGKKDTWGAPKNWSTWVNRYSFDLASDLSLSESFDMMRLSVRRSFVDIIHDGMWGENVTGSAITLLHRLKLRWFVLSTWVPSSKPFDDFIQTAASKRIQEVLTGADKEKKDFMTWLMKDLEPSENIPVQEIMEEAILLITAGGDTTSTTISSLLYYLLHEPAKLARLQDEIRSTFSSAQDIVLGSKLHSCTYLRACIDEALRLCPPAGSVLRREAEPGGVVVDDQKLFIPGGTNVGVPVSAMHHEPSFYPDPYRFQPERWIAGSTLLDGTLVTPDSVKRASSVFMPFSAGMRGCIGKPLAYLGISILYSTLMLEYEVRLCPDRWVNGRNSGVGPDPTVRYELEDIFTSWKNGPLIQLKAR